MLISATSGDVSISTFGISLISLPLLIGAAGSLYIAAAVCPFDRIGEYVFLLAIGWCLGVAELFEYAGLSRLGLYVVSPPQASPIAISL